MKAKGLLQIFVLLTLLFSPFASDRTARASSIDPLDVVIVDQYVGTWGGNYAGHVSPTRYENWHFTLTGVRHFTATVNPGSGGLVPVLLLLDSNGVELSRGNGTLTSVQPAGNYSVMVQPQSGEGVYTLSMKDVVETQPTTTSIAVSPANIRIGETATVTVSLNHVPISGYSSVELTCYYSRGLVEPSDIVVADRFGSDPVVAIKDPNYDRFIVAIAGRNDHRATTDGTLITFKARGLQAGQAIFDCQTRVSTGDNVLTRIESIGGNVIILPDTPTPSTEPAICDRAQVILDVTVPDGTVFAPGATFRKTWRLKNTGSCVWTTSYQIVFLSGEQMGAPSSANFPVSVMPGQQIDISLDMTAPSTPGSYRGYWMFRNANGTLFGHGVEAQHAWWVDIRVSGPTVTASPSATATGTPTSTPTGTLETPTTSPSPTLTPGGPTATPIPDVAYDFVVNGCAAVWYSGAGQLPCPGIDGDPRGFAIKVDNPRLETGAIHSGRAILVAPQNVQNGYIQGFYPPFRVQSGDRFRTTLGCQGGATNCYAAYRLDYQVGTENIRTFWGPFIERYEGQYFAADVDLSPLAGQDVKFILTVLAAGVATGDRMLWVDPHISRTGSATTPTSTATPTTTTTAIPGNEGWWYLRNDRYGFESAFPTRAQMAPGWSDNLTRVDLAFTPGTNLREKYVNVVATENLNVCKSSQPAPQTAETVTLNGISFLKQSGEARAAGNTYKWTAYSTSRAQVCVSLELVLHSIDPHESDIPPLQPYDEAAESALFPEMVARFHWLTSATLTPTSTLIASATPSSTPTPYNSPTSDPQQHGQLVGQVTAGKQVIVSLFDTNNNLVVAVETNNNGTYIIGAPAGEGTYTVVATAPGFLSARGFATILRDRSTTMPAISLLAGDIDNNNVIDRFDALTIGMNYNTSLPSAADLNNDGIINVLDLELLAKNYRRTGPIAWQ